MPEGGPGAELRSPDPRIRRRALLTLASQPPERTYLDAFLEVAQSDPEPSLRLLARQLYQETKKRLGGDGTLGKSLIDSDTGRFDVTSLAGILHSGDTSAKLEAIRQALEAGEPRTLEVLREHIGEQDDPWVQASILKALGTLGDSNDIHLIQPFLKSHDLRIQANAIEALELIGDELSFSLVVPMLQSPDARIRANAIKCLVRFDSDEALSTLERMAHSDELGSRESALYCMGILEHPRIPSIVTSMVPNETDAGLLEKQLMILGEEGGREAIGPLASLREHLDDHTLQQAAALALGQLRGRVPLDDTAVEQARLDFEAEHRKSKGRAGALSGLTVDEAPPPSSSSSGVRDLDAAMKQADAYMSNKRKGAKEPEAPPSAGAQMLTFFKENPSFGALMGITAMFLVASIGVVLNPGLSGPPAAADRPTRRPTRVPTRPNKPEPSKQPEKGKKVTLECTLNNLDRKRRTALVRHEGKILKVLLEDEPPKGLERKDKVEIRGFFTGKVKFGAKEFKATSLSKL